MITPFPSMRVLLPARAGQAHVGDRKAIKGKIGHRASGFAL